MVTVDSGVPQGTVLGPILFLLHINNLPSVISSTVRLFADDCLVYKEIKSRQDQNDLQKDLNLLESWGTTWGMRFNAAKCKIMRVSMKQTPIPYQYELLGQVLEEVKDAKYRGGKKNLDLPLFYEKITNESETVNQITKNSHICTCNAICIFGIVVL